LSREEEKRVCEHRVVVVDVVEVVVVVVVVVFLTSSNKKKRKVKCQQTINHFKCLFARQRGETNGKLDLDPRKD
jgi:hypothetical protein